MLASFLVVVALAQVDGGGSDVVVEAVDAGVVSTPAAPAAPAPTPPPAPTLGFDGWQSLWGPGRKTSGELFRSAATPVDEGPLRWKWKDASLAVGLQYFARSEARDNSDFNSANRDFAFGIEHRARVTARASAFRFAGAVLELQDVRGWGTEASTAALLPAAAVHQGFVDLHAGLVDVRVGRQELSYGEDRLIGSLDWGMAARAFDGLFVRVTPMTGLTVDAFGMLIKPPAFLTDASGGRFQSSGSYFTGAYGRYRLAKAGVDVYALGLLEDPSTATTGFRPDHNRLTLGTRGFVPLGPVNLVGEGALQLGTTSAKERILAGAFAARATWNLPGGVYVMGDLSAATGDGTPGDGTDSGFHQLFPTGHIHLGFIDYVGWQNVIGVRGTVGYKQPFLHVWLDLHHLRPWDVRGAWFAANGSVFLAADATRTSGVMGNEVDVSATIPLGSSVALAGCVSVFLPGGMQPATSPGNPAAWGFLSLRTQL